MLAYAERALKPLARLRTDMHNLSNNNELDLSVVIPAYRARNFIERSIQSALASSNVDLEIIIVDDCSDDGTADAVEKQFSGDKRVKILRRQSNGGPGAARNDGFELAQGRWIGVLDADDEVLPDRFQKLIQAGTVQGHELVADNITLWDHRSNQPVSKLLLTEGTTQLDLSALFGASFRTGNDYGLLKPIFLRSFLREKRLRYRDELRHGEDYEFVAEALYEGARYCVLRDYSGYRYTTRDGGLSTTSINDQAMIDQTRTWFGRPKVRQSRELRKLLRGRISTLETLRLHRMSGNNSLRGRLDILRLALKSSAGLHWLIDDLSRRISRKTKP